jgi:hypothetical protein
MIKLKGNNGSNHNGLWGISYQVLFWGVLGLFLISLGYNFLSSSKSYSPQSSAVEIAVQQKDSVKEMYNESLSQLDSLVTVNVMLSRELGRVSIGDTTNIPENQKRLIRLIDSTTKVKDSINWVIAFMNDSIELTSLPKPQVDTYIRTMNLLGSIKIKLDVTLDLIRIQFLQSETVALSGIIEKFDKKRERLGRLAKRLSNLTGIIKTTLDVLSTAVSSGIIVSPASAAKL